MGGSYTAAEPLESSMGDLLETGISLSATIDTHGLGVVLYTTPQMDSDFLAYISKPCATALFMFSVLIYDNTDLDIFTF